jgi:dipeptidyl aminopeptidase/acylaminoacyl peptidase
MFLIGGTAGRAQEPKAEARKAVDRLVEHFRKHPAPPSKADRALGLYLLSARGGEAVRIVSELKEGFNRSGSPVWSHDGRKILFDITPWDADFRQGRIKAFSLTAEDTLTTADLGPGNCPEIGPDGEKVLFLLNLGIVQNVEPGVWIMNVDGSERTRVASYGRPRWSPEDDRILVIDFAKPPQTLLVDVRPGGKSGGLQLDGLKIFSNPHWAGAGTIVASIGRDDQAEADSIALIDVDDPGRCRVKQVLWKRSAELDVVPRDALYSTVTGRCVFAGVDDKEKRALYGFDRGQSKPPARLEPGQVQATVGDLAMSPDGRYVLFASDRPDPRKPVDPKAAGKP